MSGLRERKKARRRQDILDAALALLRTNDIQAVTIEQIAALAEVSPPTVYNLVGTREQLLVALVDRVIERLVESLAAPVDGDEDPIASARLIVDESVAAFVADSDAYRQIIRSLGDFASSGSQIAFDPSRLQVAAMRKAQERGIIRDDLDPVSVGRQIYLTYVGAMFTWAVAGLSDRGFGIAARHGLSTVLAASSTERHRDGFFAELRELGDRFARATWSRR